MRIDFAQKQDRRPFSGMQLLMNHHCHPTMIAPRSNPEPHYERF